MYVLQYESILWCTSTLVILWHDSNCVQYALQNSQSWSQAATAQPPLEVGVTPLQAIPWWCPTWSMQNVNLCMLKLPHALIPFCYWHIMIKCWPTCSIRGAATHFIITLICTCFTTKLYKQLQQHDLGAAQLVAKSLYCSYQQEFLVASYTHPGRGRGRGRGRRRGRSKHHPVQREACNRVSRGLYLGRPTLFMVRTELSIPILRHLKGQKMVAMLFSNHGNSSLWSHNASIPQHSMLWHDAMHRVS